MKTEQHAYRLAPWRKQLQNILNILLVLVFGASIALVYLYYSAQMTDMKLQIQVLHEDRNTLTRNIADYVTRQGVLSSFDAMEKKATQAGFVKIDFDNEDIYSYMLVPGYVPESASGLNREIKRQPLPVTPLKPEYTESLQHYLLKNLPIVRSEQ